MAAKVRPETVTHGPCAADGCTRIVGPKGAKGFCPSHYKRFAVYGDPLTEFDIGKIPPLRKHDPICTVGDCGRPVKARGYCERHLARWSRLGSVELPQKPTTEERFWAKAAKTDGCWEWQGSRHPVGHGYFGLSDGTIVYAHRFSWELKYGAIPTAYQVNHLCDNPPCVRPDHLYIGTQRENFNDMVRGKRNRRLLKVVAPAQRSML